MADPRSRLQVVEDLPEPAPANKPDPFVSVGATALMLGLKALSQRAAAAAKTWFTLASVASAWWLWLSVPNPNPAQLTALGIYGGFILIANVIVRKC